MRERIRSPFGFYKSVLQVASCGVGVTGYGLRGACFEFSGAGLPAVFVAD